MANGGWIRAAAASALARRNTIMITGWAIFGMVVAALIVLLIVVCLLTNIKDLARYLKISSM
jgi:hypothetical protein